MNVDTVGSGLDFEHQFGRTAGQASFCIAIAGPSGSGKTSIAQELGSMLPGKVVLLGLDSYYYDLSHLPHAERSTTNFDRPHALEHPLLIEQVCALRGRCPIQKPIYDFASHTRLRGKSETVESGDYLIVEGLFPLFWAEFRAIFDLTVFVDAADGLCLKRRQRRDVSERGRTEESVTLQYEATVRPGNEQFVLPTRFHADMVVGGEQQLAVSAEQIFQQICIRERSLRFQQETADITL